MKLKLNTKLFLVGVAASFSLRDAVQAFPSFAMGGGAADDNQDAIALSDTMQVGHFDMNFSLSLFNDRVNRVACPAMRFLTREGIMNELFEACGFIGEVNNPTDMYGVDAESMKALIGAGKGGLGLRFDLIMTKKTDGVLTSSVLDRAFSGAIDGQAFDSDETMILNVDQLEMNFDHSASSGIIGSATNEANGLDHDAVNWDRFYEFVSKMCDCSAYPGSYIPQSFTVDEVGRAVNHFGKQIEDEALRESTDVGPFSWGILAFEWANTFEVFKKDGKLPYDTFKKLFQPVDLDNVHIDRDEHASEIWLGDTFCAMDIKISPIVKNAMDAAHTNNECPYDPNTLDDGRRKTQCKVHGLLTDLCGPGFENCLEAGGHPGCPHTELGRGSSCTSSTQCSADNCYTCMRSRCVENRCSCVFSKQACFGTVDTLPYCSSSLSPSKRFLSEQEGHVIHYNEGTGTIPRQDVVNAVEAVLNGADNFVVEVVNVANTAKVFEMTRNGLETSQTNNFDEAFWVSNNFLPSMPQIPFTISCPPTLNDEGEINDACYVTTSNSEPSSTSNSAQEAPFGSCLLKDSNEITKECLAEEYDLSLFVIPGPHFVLGATTDRSCPNLAFASTNGQKQVFKFEPEDVPTMQEDSVHPIVTTSLGEIVDAVSDAEPIDPGDFHLEINNCVHYASSIWRKLDFAETHDLARFIINAISNDSNVKNLAKESTGGAHYLAAKAGGDSAALRYIEALVYSQLIIK